MEWRIHDVGSYFDQCSCRRVAAARESPESQRGAPEPEETDSGQCVDPQIDINVMLKVRVFGQTVLPGFLRRCVRFLLTAY
jgi:hypothetical protein